MTYLTTHNNRWRDHKVIIEAGGAAVGVERIGNWNVQSGSFFSSIFKRRKKIKKPLVVGRLD